MSDSPTPADVAPKPQEPAQEPQRADVTTEPKADEVDWKAEARKWEQRAKENKAAADSGKSETEQLADRLAEVEKQYAQAEARANRREVALEFRLSKEDAGLLDAITDEKAMRSLAERLAGEADKKQNHVPREGNNPKPVQSGDEREFVRELFGRANAD